MNDIRTADDVTKSDTKPGGNEQFPTDTRVVTKVRFVTSDPGGDVLKIVIMNDMTTVERAAAHEYNHGATSVSIESLASFTMVTGTIEATQRAIDDFTGGMPLQITTAQAATWHRGVYAPTAARKRLFKAIDPDDSTRMIGVLLEQDAQGHLANLTWYKAQDSGVIFRVTPGRLSFEQVTSASGAPSLDPNDIGGWAWYYATTSGGTG
jgi:hypothetical protein